MRIWHFRLDRDDDIALHDAALSLSPDETERANRYRFDRDRRRYVQSRGALRRVLGGVLNCTPDTLVFSYGAAGKPVLGNDLDGGPSFNLSHCDDHCVIATCLSGNIGIDIEVLSRKMDDLESLAERCFTPRERAVIAKASDPLTRFLAFWTAKESRMKLTGEGFGLDPLSIELALDETGLPVGFQHPPHPKAKLTGFRHGPLIGALALD